MLSHNTIRYDDTLHNHNDVQIGRHEYDMVVDAKGTCSTCKCDNDVDKSVFLLSALALVVVFNRLALVPGGYWCLC